LEWGLTLAVGFKLLSYVIDERSHARVAAVIDRVQVRVGREEEFNLFGLVRRRYHEPGRTFGKFGPEVVFTNLREIGVDAFISFIGLPRIVLNWAKLAVARHHDAATVLLVAASAG
jgi:hypothetical protein